MQTLQNPTIFPSMLLKSTETELEISSLKSLKRFPTLLKKEILATMLKYKRISRISLLPFVIIRIIAIVISST